MKHANTALNIVPTPFGDQADPIKNDDYSSQLRQLRQILGKRFKQISVRKFADAARIPNVAIAAIEANRRVLNDVDRENLEVFLGACWNTESHSWVCSRDYETPYTRFEYETHCRKVLNNPEWGKDYPKSLHEAIDELIGDLEVNEAVRVVIELRAKLRGISKTLKDKQK
jgi:hypothetical protein